MTDKATIELEEISDDISDVTPLDIPALAIFVILFVIVALQFFTRYVLNDSLGWTEEIARYFLVMLGFVGAITCVRRKSHIHLEFLYHHLAPRQIKALTVAVEALVTAFWGYAGWLGIELAQKTSANMVSVAVPKSYLYYVVVAGCWLMTYHAFKILVRQLRLSSAAVATEKLDHPVKGL